MIVLLCSYVDYRKCTVLAYFFFICFSFPLFSGNFFRFPENAVFRGLFWVTSFVFVLLHYFSVHFNTLNAG